MWKCIVFSMEHQLFFQMLFVDDIQVKRKTLNLEGIFSENKETVINMYLETPGESEQGDQG